jgi:hypothetical protein
MNRLPLLSLLCAALFSHGAQAQDPTLSDGDKYSVVLDNARVRVLRYQDQPGERTQQHQHPAFVVVALAPFKRKIALGDGRVMAREFKAGDAMFSEGETHIGENVGSTPTQVLMVELKAAAGCPASR